MPLKKFCFNQADYRELIICFLFLFLKIAKNNVMQLYDKASNIINHKVKIYIF